MVGPVMHSQAFGLTGVVPVHDEATVLRKVLGAIEGQSRKLDELILVFDRCSDGSEHLADGREFISLIADHGNTGAAVQAGVERASYPVIILFDGNTLVPSNYVERLVTAWADTQADVIEWHGGLMLVTKSTLERYGPFSTRALWTLEYFLRVRSAGGCVVPLRGPFSRLKPSPLRRNFRYGLDYADLSVRFDLPPFFRVGTKSGVIRDSCAALGAALGHARRHNLRSALRRTRLELRRPSRRYATK